MKESISSSFGLLIAFLLPGVVGFHALAFQFPELDDLYTRFLVAESNVGIFFYVVLIALVIGLQITVFRWIVFEEIVFKRIPRYKIPGGLYKKLSDDKMLSAFRAAVDELYRYHQCYGGLAVGYLLYFLLAPKPENLTDFQWYAVSVVVEGLTIAAAFDSYKRFADKVWAILGGKGVTK